MARYDLQVNGKLLPRGDVSWPSRFRVGFRGPGPGMREAGMLSFSVKDVSGYYRHSADRIRTDQEVVATRAREKIFRGVVTKVVKNDKTKIVYCQAKEQSATVGDYKGGMRCIGSGLVGIQNPDLYVWAREEERNGSQVLHVFTEEFYQESGWENRATMEKQWLFTNYGWLPDSLNHGGYKLPIAEPKDAKSIAMEAARQYMAQADLDLQVGTVDTDGASWEGQLRVRDENDDVLRTGIYGGLVTQGNHVYVYWYDGSIQSIQLGEVINRSRVKLLGQIPISGRAGGPINTRPWIVENTRDPSVLAWYWMRANYDSETGVMYQTMNLTYVRLNEPEGTDPTAILNPVTVTETYEFSDGRRREWVYSTPSTLWELSETPSPQEEKELDVNGGRYLLNHWQSPDNLNLSYIGNILLDDMVYDFTGASLAQILTEVAYVTGCDWWVGPDGRIEMRRVDRIAGVGVLKGEILEEETIEEAVRDEDFEKSVRGISISKAHGLMLAEKWGQHKRERLGGGKHLKVKVSNTIGVKLGEQVQVAGRRHGVLEAMEFSGDEVVLETAL